MEFANLRDGDAIVTKHGFIFYIFGYQHLPTKYYGFLKYVPNDLIPKFELNWLPYTWKYQGSILLRPTEIYDPNTYPKLIDSFKKHFPEYIYYDPDLSRSLIIIPHYLIQRAYVPKKQLRLLMERGPKDSLEKKSLELISLISNETGISLNYFGIHGSISLGTHQEGSDIDLSVYGANNYTKVKSALNSLEKKGLFQLKRDNRIDAKRLNRGLFKKIDVVVNATRKRSEIIPEQRTYIQLGSATVKAKCVSALEAPFRPATYKIKNPKPLNKSHHLTKETIEIVSMIGMYRDIAKEGDILRARGILEEVITPTRNRWVRLVVGSGRPHEYIEWKTIFS
jgi:predicted nucleotidyltransferase